MQLKNHPSVGLGAMELAFQEKRPSIDEAHKMIDSLIAEHGLTYIDTADAYALGEEDFGYGERIMARYMKRDDVLVASKIGFTRQGTTWKACGTPEYLRKACDLSLKNLGVDSIPLCQFHTPDPNVPIVDSIGELSRLQSEGKIQSIGVCNFMSDEALSEAMSVAKIVSLQNPLSVLFYEQEPHDEMLQFCETNDITFVAFAPLGGHRNPTALETVPPLIELAAAEGITVRQLALLFLKSLSPNLISIPGSIVKEHIIENLAVNQMTLRKEVKAQILEFMTEAEEE